MTISKKMGERHVPKKKCVVRGDRESPESDPHALSYSSRSNMPEVGISDLRSADPVRGVIPDPVIIIGRGVRRRRKNGGGGKGGDGRTKKSPKVMR